MQFDWDDDKAKVNRVKHGVDFRDAIAAVLDPRRLDCIDDRFDYGEERIQVIGMARRGVLFVVIVEADGNDETICRIISARKATRDEQETYFDQG